MSLALAERASIRLYLGIPDKFRFADTRLEGMLDNITDEAVDQVRKILANLAIVDNLILTVGLTNVGLSRVDEIYWQRGALQINQQRRQGRQYISQLSIILGVCIYSDFYGADGYRGDSFSPFGNRANGTRFFNIG